MGEWSSVPLGQLIEPDRGISYGIVQPGPPVSNGIPIVRVSDVKDGRIATTNCLKVSPEIESGYARTRLKGGELLITVVGTVGETAIVPGNMTGWNVARAIAVLPIRKDVGAYWVQLALRSPAVRSRIDSRLNTTVQATLNLGDVAQLPILLPPLQERTRIASILGWLDEKIDLNRRMNETLEAMARAIFKDWFVDFGPTRAKAEGRAPYLAPALWALFPDTLDDDGKPVGWAFEKLGRAATVSIGRTPSRSRHDCFVEPPEGVTWLSIRDLGNITVYAMESAENLTDEAVREFRVPVIPADTVIVSFKLTVGRVAITAGPMTSNEAIAHLVMDQRKLVSNKYLYCFMRGYDYYSLASTSSIATAVNSDSIREISVLLASQELQRSFEKQVSPLLEKVRSQLEESRTLAAMRDLLLPKLMSGEIRLREAEKLIKQVE
jgi:type I restriction enzyme, S subunit